MEWIKPPFLDEEGNWKDTATEDNPEGDWPWCGDKFLAAVQLTTGWDYAVVCFTETGLEMDGESFGWSAEDISWMAKISTPPKEK